MTEHRLYRIHSSPFDTIGIWKRGIALLCFTIEDERRDVKVRGETRIPAGLYRLTLEHSPKFSPRPQYGHPMITVNGVPNFSGIRVHMGNTSDDSEGCILTGEYPVIGYEGKPSRIVASSEAYRRMYEIVASDIRDGETWLTVLNEEHLAMKSFDSDTTPLTVG